MPDVVIERALYRRERSDEPRLLARSPHLPDELLALIVDLLVAFGERPPGISCRGALFAHPLGEGHVAVVQVADAATGPEGWASLQFTVFVLTTSDYESLGGDPFALAKRLAPISDAAIQPALSNNGLESLTLPAVPLTPMGVEDVRKVLKRIKANALPDGADPKNLPPLTSENAESPMLLGGVQLLVDGGKLVFERPAPDASVVEALWTLLPYRMRPRLWPATFAFSNDLGFDVLVTPRVDGIDLEGYTTEAQAGDYPQGSYELALQIAAEAGDARDLDAAFRRRTSNETLWLGVKLLVGLSLLVVATRLLIPLVPQAPSSSTRPADLPRRAAEVTSAVGLHDSWSILSNRALLADARRRAAEAASAVGLHDSWSILCNRVLLVKR